MDHYSLVAGDRKHGGLDAFLEYCRQTKKGVRQKRKTDAVGRAFLEHCMPGGLDGFLEINQSDGGREFSQVVDAYCDRHRIARPYKKNEQALIENFKRSLRKECLGWAKYGASQILHLSLQGDDWYGIIITHDHMFL